MKAIQYLRKAIFIGMLMLLIPGVFITGETIIVTSGKSIQAAINDPLSTTIIVNSGTYNESIVINKAIILKSNSGANSTVIAGSINIQSKNITIQGFTIKNPNYGIHNDYGDCTITNNIFTNNTYGIYMYSCSSLTNITNNTFLSNTHGIYSYHCPVNISGNNFQSHTDAINLIYSNGTISGNQINYNQIGIRFDNSQNTISNNTLSNNTATGIYLSNTAGNSINNNTISLNEEGILFDNSAQNIIANNSINKNKRGVHLYRSSNNQITNNAITDNTYNGGDSYAGVITEESSTIILSAGITFQGIQ
jgi:parallel beta-helix repeat protein